MINPSKRDDIDIRIDGPHKIALANLQRRNADRSAVETVRTLIRDAAKAAGIWPEPDDLAESPEAEIAQPELA